jgi:pimeloyl-ACP methyl ester carboxylesterase
LRGDHRRAVVSVLSCEVQSGEVRLSVRELPHDRAPTVILVHGFPDNQVMWEPMAARLHAQRRLHVVTYDTRGAGGSSAPANTSGYRIERLVDDLVAVMDRTSPDAPVHLVGHDWGSIQLWGAVTAEDTDARLQGRIATFTSISGPPLDYMRHVLRTAAADRDLDLLRSQACRSWYVAAFQVPWLPELGVRALGWLMRARLNRTERWDHAGHWNESLTSDAAHGINLYRANLRWGRRLPPLRTDVPVQLVVPQFDQFLDPRLYGRLGDFVSNLTRVDLPAGHWVPRTAPELVARLVADHVHAHP